MHGIDVVRLQPIAMEAGHQVSISLVTIRQRVPTRLRVKEVLRVSLQREKDPARVLPLRSPRESSKPAQRATEPLS